jgi:cobalt-zinc-cadmium efflux system outer membrane protein
VIRPAGIDRLAAIGATTAVLWLSPAAAGDQTLHGATVESVVAIAKRLNPTVAAASLDFDAAVHKIGTAGVLADPVLVLEAWDVNRLGVGQRRFGVEQEVKLWGKYGLERDIAQSDADAAKFQGRATVIDLVAQVIAAHGEYNAAYEAVAISVEIKRRYDAILGLLRSRYGTTSVDQQDVIKAEIEAATAEGDVIRRQGEQKPAAAWLNALIGRPTLAPLAAPTGFRAVKPISLAQVQALARSANPMLALAGAQRNSAAPTKSLTDLNYYPDVTLGAKHVQRPGTEDTVEFMAGFKVPLHCEVKDADQRAAGARLGAAQARAEALRLRIDGQIADAKLKVELQTKYAEMERLAGGSL